MTTKKQDNPESTGALEESLFDDLDLPPSQPTSTPATPLSQILSNSPERSNTPYPPMHAPPTPRKATTTSALKIEQEEESSRAGLWAVLALLVLGGGGAGAYFAGVIPGLRPQATRTPPPVVGSKRTVSISSTPKGAQIKIDGKSYQKPTPSILFLTTGESHEIEISKTGCTSTSKTMTFDKGPTAVKAEFTLTCTGQAPVRRVVPNTRAIAPRQRFLAPPAASGLGYVKLTCKPKGAQVKIGESVKLTCGGTNTLPLMAKEYDITISKRGYASYTGKVNISPKQTSALKIALKRKRSRRSRSFSRVSLSSTPKASVFYRGRKIGMTPLTHRFPAGRIRVTLKTPFGSKRTLSLRLKPKRNVSKKITFPKGTMKFFITPWGNVYINGKKVGQTPIPPQRRPEGVYKIEIRKGGKKHKRTVRLFSGNSLRIQHSF